MTSVQDRLVAVVSSRPEERRDVDIELAVPWLRKKSELLQSLEKDTLKDVIRNCGYQRTEKDEIIIQQGDKGNCFYIMLTGRTSVYIDTTRTDEETPPQPKDGGQKSTEQKQTHHAPLKRGVSITTMERKTVSKNDDTNADDISTEKPTDKRYDKKGALIRDALGKFIMHFEAGQSFGEIALISDNCVRNATIVADTSTDLLVIHRDLFNSYIRASQVQEYEERQKFVEQCPLFRGWNAKFRNLLEMSLRKEVHPFGSVIVQQGAPVTGLVFILRGQAKITIDPSRHMQQYKKLMTKSKSFIPTNTKNKGNDSDDDNEGRRHHIRSKTPVTSAQIGIRRKLGYAAAERRLMTKTVDICCIENAEILGDVEMVLDLATNTETVISTATTTVLVLNTKNYERLVTKKHAFTVTRLVQWAHNKVSTRSKSSKGQCIELFQHLETELKEKLPRTPPPAKQIEILKEQEIVMNQLVDLFVQGKAPLIQPCVPNSLFYRQRSAKRNKVLMENPYAQLRTLKHIDIYGRMRRKVPRSIQQLRNNINAERELLKDDRRELAADISTNGASGKGTNPYGLFLRPKSSISESTLKITECGPVEDRFGVTSAHLDSSDRLNRKALAEIYQELEQVNRETQEMRMRLVCSTSAKQAEMQRAEKDDTNGIRRAKSAAAGFNVMDLSTVNDDTDASTLVGAAGPDCFDWETSETNLRDLENRVSVFCRSVTPSMTPRKGRTDSRPSSRPSSRPGTAGVPDSPAIVEMKRFEIEDPTSIPLPGAVVYVHKKPCKFSAGPVSPSPTVHKHTRRFILSRDVQKPWLKGNTPAATSIGY